MDALSDQVKLWNGGMTFSPRSRNYFPKLRSFPLGRRPAIIVASILSLLSTTILSLSIGSHSQPAEIPLFLQQISSDFSGVFIIGESIDADVEEPSITVTWALLGCGQDFVWNNATILTTGASCGMLAMKAAVFVDGSEEPVIQYDPMKFSVDSTTNLTNFLPSLFHFETEHVPNTKNAVLYPFDSYTTSTSFQLREPDSGSVIPINKISLINSTTGNLLDVSFVDIPTISTTNGVQGPSRDVRLELTRSSGAIAYALLYFIVNWTLTHLAICLAVLSWADKGVDTPVKVLVLVFAAVVAIPHLRSSMPDAPDTQGDLTDNIGFFPQMVLVGICIIFSLLVLVLRVLSGVERKNREAELPRTLQLPRSLPDDSSIYTIV
ncbi:hypothetical protein SISSUDRAFT_1041269 [Sistotremastrum suecicum HHB10207 ss-3]|uniref:Uncharacterized protein n=1 Tax=Sistotremastrum suecicum HHB10207 ss-3 TaxID=1314776 RepID=A0A166HFB7_9AGAM|nr:hypothetical protein SISSUDRAFT_1041269 [Sistotremastrum suecicum HHB10207 ss-3]